MEQSIIDFSLPLAVLVEKKIQYHRSIIEFHESEIKSAYALLNKEEGKSEKRNEVATNHSKKAFFTINNKRIEVSQKNIKPLVLDFFVKNRATYSSPKVYENFLKIGLVESENDRKVWIQAISLSIGNLTKSGKITMISENNISPKIYTFYPLMA